MEYVVAVAEHGTFTQAARSIPVSQPALSQGIQALERELGVELFARIGRTVRRTAAGDALLEPARQILRDVRSARAAVDAITGLEQGRLDVVCLPTLAVDPLVDLLGRFRRDHPGITVHVREPEDSSSLTALVGTGDAELGLAELPVTTPGLTGEPLLDQEILLVCPPGTKLPGTGRRRVALAVLESHALVATPVGTSTRRLAEDAIGQAGIDLEIAVETEHREALVPLVMAGAGIALLPEPMARRAESLGATVARLDPPLRRHVGLVRRTDATLSPAAAAFRRRALGLDV